MVPPRISRQPRHSNSMVWRQKKNRSSSKRVNWLKKFDKAVASWPRANSWTQHYGDFVLARHPKLRPRATRSNPAPKNQLLIGKRCFEKRISGWMGRLRTETPIIVEDLNSQLLFQLAALIIDCIEDLEFRKHYSEEQKRLTQAKKQPRAKLDAKFQAACSGLENLLNYVRPLHPYHGVIDPSTIVKECLERLRACKFAPRPTQQWGLLREGLANIMPNTDHQRSLDLVYLYWFFRHGCNLTNDDAECRTGTIRNIYLTKWGAKKVNVLERHTGSQSRGCKSVERAVSRYNDSPTR